MLATPARKKVWLDCDPGHDDMLAIIMAGYDPNVELLGISTVAGNQTVEKTTKNAIKTLYLAGIKGVPVFCGQSVPMLRRSLVCPEIHGTTGLNLPEDSNEELQQAYYNISPDQKPGEGKAVLKMFETISNSFKKGTKVSVASTGCLTNLALLLILFPEVKEMIEEIVIMGGCIGVGNINPGAEFNILLDPEAAKIVFDAQLPLVMVPLECTHTVCFTPLIRETVEKTKTPFMETMSELMRFFADTYKNVFGFDYPPVHDPVAVFRLIYPQFFTEEKMRVEIDTTSSLSPGRTVCDIFHMSDEPKNVTVTKAVEVEEFWKVMVACMEKASAASPFKIPPKGSN